MHVSLRGLRYLFGVLIQTIIRAMSEPGFLSSVICILARGLLALNHFNYVTRADGLGFFYCMTGIPLSVYL